MSDQPLRGSDTGDIHPATLDALPDPVFVFDEADRVQYANTAACDATGYGDDIVGVPLSDLLARVTAETARELSRRADAAPVDASLVAVDGDETAVEVRVSALTDATDDERIVMVARTGYCADDLAANTAGMLDRMADAFFAVDEDWELTYVNEHASTILSEAMGVDAGDPLVGRDLWAEIPDAVDTVFYDQYHEAMATQEPVSFEEYYEPMDSWIAVRAYPSTSGLSVYFQDVTARREDEAALRERERVLRRMHDITADTDRSFDEQVNALLELGIDVLGVSTGALSRFEGDTYEFEAVAGDTDTQPGDTVPVSATNCERTAATERTLVLANVAQDAPELTEKVGYADWGVSCYLGAPVFVEEDVYGTFCFYDEAPRPDSFSEWEITVVDLMSQWVGYEKTRRAVRERLEAQNEKLDRFAAIVSHDLRNPLNVLAGFLELAEETGDADHFERCRRSVERMESLVDDLLSLARAGEGVADLAPTELGAVALESWGTVDTRDATLQVAVDTEVLADENRLGQLFVNLFRNAVEHGGDSVTVTVGALDDGFYVADDGPGIPESGRDDVFDAGYTTTDEGTGFGLSIVDEVATAHGWTVSLAVSDEGGARFEFGAVELT